MLNRASSVAAAGCRDGGVAGRRSRRRPKPFEVDTFATATDSSSMFLPVCGCTLSRSMEVVGAGTFVGQGFHPANGCVTSGADGTWHQGQWTRSRVPGKAWVQKRLAGCPRFPTVDGLHPGGAGHD